MPNTTLPDDISVQDKCCKNSKISTSKNLDVLGRVLLCINLCDIVMPNNTKAHDVMNIIM